MSKYITVVYDTDRWNKNALPEIYAIESSVALYYGDAIEERNTLEHELQHIKDLHAKVTSGR